MFPPFFYLSLAVARAKGTSDGAEVDVIYDVEAETGCDFSEEAPPGQPCKFRDAVAPKISRPGMLSSVFVLPGRSLVFAAKREHLNKYLRVFVQYSYEWETSEEITNFEEPRHRVYFRWFKFETALKKERTKGDEVSFERKRKNNRDLPPE